MVGLHNQIPVFSLGLRRGPRGSLAGSGCDAVGGRCRAGAAAREPRMLGGYPYPAGRKPAVGFGAEALRAPQLSRDLATRWRPRACGVQASSSGRPAAATAGAGVLPGPGIRPRCSASRGKGRCRIFRRVSRYPVPSAPIFPMVAVAREAFPPPPDPSSAAARRPRVPLPRGRKSDSFG
ncbi:hypothetical protein PSMK_26670 [Phycisphaera mikurensis NBRC 102666]|uniref:Uncharacterized protein n=1 Tax=Phycisphaera mikurensis (strain NBRC 102666 / KCTC 22515 / FYK2301M01) TaxID=1142394 RepID=I0IHT8_PHYMF|nr:hypothetical protein PSMK_26670 [Phycisphaera mikurensis NBRC 102666]